MRLACAAGIGLHGRVRDLSEYRLKAESAEFLHLDAIRIFAATAIVLYHFGSRIYVGANWHLDVYALQVCVDLFFFVSGFIITRFYGQISSFAQYKIFLRKRVARLYPLHLATAAFFVLVGISFSAGLIDLRIPDQFDFRCLPANLVLVHSLSTCDYLTFNPVSWSISAEMILYIIFPVTALLRKLHFAIPLIASAVIIGFLSYLFSTASVRPWYLWSYDYGVFRAFPSFLFGMACYDARHHIARIPFPNLMFWLSIVLFVALICSRAPMTAALASVYLIGITGIGADQRNVAGKIIRRIAPWGSLTYSIYMIHPIVDMLFLSLIGSKIFGLTHFALNIWIGFCLVLTFAAAWISLFLFETPARLLLTSTRSKKVRDPETPSSAELVGGEAQSRSQACQKSLL